jgi:hypothetical protein
LSSVVLALVVTQAGFAASPLIIVAVVVAYIATDRMHAYRGRDRMRAPVAAGPTTS